MSKDQIKSTLFDRARTSAPPVTQTSDPDTTGTPPEGYLQGSRWDPADVTARSAPNLSPATADNKGQRPRHIPTTIEAKPDPNNT